MQMIPLPTDSKSYYSCSFYRSGMPLADLKDLAHLVEVDDLLGVRKGFNSTFRLTRSAQIAFRRSRVPVTAVYFVLPWAVGV